MTDWSIGDSLAEIAIFETEFGTMGIRMSGEFESLVICVVLAIKALASHKERSEEDVLNAIREICTSYKQEPGVMH